MLLPIFTFDNFDNALGSQKFLDLKIFWYLKKPRCLRVFKRSLESVNSVDNVDNVDNIANAANVANVDNVDNVDNVEAICNNRKL